MPENSLSEPLPPQEAVALIRRIIRDGKTRFRGHARSRMDEHDLEEPDVLNVLRAGLITEPAELERGSTNAVESWRYRIHTDRICVVVAFASPTTLVVVTCWRK